MRIPIGRAVACWIVLAAGCSAEQPSSAEPDDAGAGDGSGCQAAATLAYTISYTTSGACATLRSFDPSTLTFHEIGTMNCTDPYNEAPNTLAIARDATAYVATYGGSVLKVSLDDASIEPTAYVRQDNQRIYGFAFASDSNSATTESLYACTDDATHPQGVMGRGLAKLSVPAFTTSPIADYTNGLAGRPCMPTGNAAGELFGMFYFGTSGAPLELAQIDPATAATPTITQLPISLLANHDGSIPFVFWGGDFWFFVPDNSVVRYHYSTDKSFEMVLAPDRSKPIVTGAAVSTCAPVFL